MSTILLPLLFISAIGILVGVTACLLDVGGSVVLEPTVYYLFASHNYGGDQLMQLSLISRSPPSSLHLSNLCMPIVAKGAVDWDILTVRDWGNAIGAISVPVFATAIAVTLITTSYGQIWSMPSNPTPEPGLCPASGLVDPEHAVQSPLILTPGEQE